MAHPVPEPFTWDSSFEVFYEHLDAEHRGLFDAIAAMHDAPADSSKLNHLIKVSNDHFKSEEVMMEKAKYKDYKPHKVAHDEFLAKLKGLSCPVKVETSDYCKNWLVQHIKSIDAKYEGKLH